MNYKMIFYVLARMLKLLTGLLIIPMLVSLMYNESSKTTVSLPRKIESKISIKGKDLLL